MQITYWTNFHYLLIVIEIYPNNPKFKEFGDILFESLKNTQDEIEPEMDLHMKLNADGEYEYMYSSDENEEEHS